MEKKYSVSQKLKDATYDFIVECIRAGQRWIYNAHFERVLGVSHIQAFRARKQLEAEGKIKIFYERKCNSRDKHAPMYFLPEEDVYFFEVSNETPCIVETINTTPALHKEAVRPATRYIPNQIATILAATDKIIARVDRYARDIWSTFDREALERERDKYQNFARTLPRVAFVHLCAKRLARMVKASLDGTVSASAGVAKAVSAGQ